MKTLAVCGDSWCTSDLAFPGKSFGEIISANKNWNLISLARSGCSNFTIALQIDKAIEMEVDAVIFGTTTPDRIEIPMEKGENNIVSKLMSAINWKEWSSSYTHKFDKSRGLSNIQYAPHPDLSSQLDFLTDPTIISEHIYTFIVRVANSEFYHLSDDQIAALKAYVTHLYDYGVKLQTDTWIINDACRRLLASKIPFLVIEWSEFSDELTWLPRENRIPQDDFNLTNRTIDPETRFHYNITNDGIEIANYFQQRLDKLL